MKHSLLNYARLQRATFLLEACIHPVSRRILRLLNRHEEMTFYELSRWFCFDFDKVRFQLALLQKAGIVRQFSCDREIIYHLNAEKLGHIKMVLSDFCENYTLEEAELEW